MKKVVIALVLVLALSLSIVPSFAENGPELLEFDVDESRLAGDTWEVEAGRFCGPTQCPDSGQFEWEAKDADGIRVFPTKETVVDGGTAAIRLAVDAETGMLDFGTFYGIMDKVQANTTYTAKMTYKCTAGNTEGYQDSLAAIVLGYANKSEVGNGGAAEGNFVLLTLDSADYVTTELVFTTGASVDGASLVTGPNGFLGLAAAGYELLISNLELYEGDVTTPDTGDAGFAAVIVLSTALLAVVVIKKKEFVA